MSLVSLDAIETRVGELMARISAERHHVTFGRSHHDGTPHVEVGDAYHFVVCERGSELSRRTTGDLDELLYWVFAAITFSMACAWEVRHRRAGEDFRRQMFARQVELLAMLSPVWAEREEAEHQAILARHPFRDG
jgi:hypothetical protein